MIRTVKSAGFPGSRKPFSRRNGGASQALAAIVLGLAGISAASAQALYSVTELAPAPGYSGCQPSRMNDLGDVVGSCTSPTSGQEAVVWRNGVMSDVGRLTGGTFSYASAINSLGTITGDGDTGNGRPQSWVTTGVPGVLQNIFPNSGGNTHTLFIGDNGMIGGYYTKSLSGNTSSWKGAIWTPDPKDPRKYVTTDLPVLPGGVNTKATNSLPFAFNQVGQAAGYASNDQIGQHAAFWNNDAAHSVLDLGVFPGDWSSMANGMNDYGYVVGVSNPPFGSRPVIWSNDAAHTPSALPVLPGDNYGSANAINNLGQILGFSYYGTPGTWAATPQRQVIWRDGGVFELQSLLDPASGWTIANATAINNRGQIVGVGVRNGVGSAILLTPQ
jgi:uncharacterized membrane protein